MSEWTEGDVVAPERGVVELWSVPAAPGTPRERSVARRSWLRRVLGERLGVPAGSLEFRHGAYGKPRLAAATPLHFSLSATAANVYVALACDPVGVDAEPAWCEPLPFLHRWTAEEAVTKALGCGLGNDLELEIDATVGGPRLLRLGSDDPHQWSLSSRILDGETVVTVAVRSPQARWVMRAPEMVQRAVAS